MIKTLRRKLVVVIMGVVALILLAIFIVILTSTQNSIERSSMEALRQALDNRFIVDIQNRNSQVANGPPSDSRMPTMVIETDEYGNYSVLVNRIYNMDEEDLEKIVEIALDNPGAVGSVDEHDLRFMKKEADETTLIAFADTSLEKSVIGNLVWSSILIGSGALLVFLVLSIYLANWAVKPVERAWSHQRQFVADASHELKTPLTVILSNAELLASGRDNIDEKDAERLENIRAEGIRMKQLIKNMLILARSDFMETTDLFSKVCMSDVVMDSVLLFESVIYEEGKYLDYDIKENIMVVGDAGKLRQLIDILLDNANKYTERGRNIRVELSISSKNSVHLSVSNEGKLIPREEREKIFRRFYRMDKSRENHGGFGLGLSIAQSVVLSHKGKIWIESSEEKGNVFNVILPVSKS